MGLENSLWLSYFTWRTFETKYATTAPVVNNDEEGGIKLID